MKYSNFEFSLLYVFDENTSEKSDKDFVTRKKYIFAFNFFMRMFSNVYYSSQFSKMTSK